MPKKSKGSKSKRMSLRQKYKVIRKVKEHQKKKKKEMKKLGIKPKAPKDPGLPSQWPFKEELIKEFQFKKDLILAEEKRRKEERKRARQEAAAMDTDGNNDLMQLAALQQAADAKQSDFEQRKKARIASDPQSDIDNSRKAFYKEFKKVVEAADVVIQVLDARDPLACRCPDVERYIRSISHNKRIILLLNKMDLVPREVGEKWLAYFREELPTVAFKCSTQQQASNISQKKMAPAKSSADALHGAGCLGADTLLQLLKNYTRNLGIKTAITVGVIGLPNVGKSSLINSLKRARVAQVGNTPGVTKAVQEVHLDKHIKLLDSPGIVFSSAESDAAAALRNCVKVERLQDPILPVTEVLRRVEAKELMGVYKVGAFKDVDQFLQHIAAARGKLKKGGIPDMLAAARIVLQDWNDGRIPFFTLPPSRGNEEFADAQIVAGWASDFNANEVFANERSAVIAHLPSMDDDKAEFFQAQSAGALQVDMSAMMEADKPSSKKGGDAMEGSSEGEEEEDAMDDDEYGAPSSAQTLKQRAAAVGSAGVLYSEEGQFNPHAARAERKKRKKQKEEAGPAGEGDDDSDFDFGEMGEGEGGSGDEGSSGDEEGSEEGSDDDGMEGSDLEEEEDE